MSSSYLCFLNITGTKFNTTCCREKGVVEQCIGNCMDAENLNSEGINTYCDQFSEMIAECTIVNAGNIK